jgi:phospholipid/cholesterol/gamma-HCH transport system substrate-binding protein
MAQDFTNAAKVGLMAVVLAGAAYGGYRFVARDGGAGNGYRVYAYLPDVTGVAPRSRVMISGIQVGMVDDIRLEGGRARVEIKMNPDVPLFVDAAVGKRSTSLIGEYYVVLVPGTNGREQIPNGGQVTRLLDEPTLESLQGQVSDILKDVKTVTETLKNTVGTPKGQDEIARILKNLAEVTEQLNQTVKENRAGIKDTINNINAITTGARPDILAILANVRKTTDDVKKMVGDGQELAVGPRPGAQPGAPGTQGPGTQGPVGPGQPGGGPGQPGGQPGGGPAQPGIQPGGGPGQQAAAAPAQKGEIRSAVERINRASKSLESMLEHADNVAARIDRGEGTVGRLTKDETLINEVEGAVENVGDLLAGIGRLQTVVQLRTDYNFLANTVKSYVSLRLQPSEDKYYLIELVSDPRGLTTFEQIDVDTTNPNDPPHYREVRTITRDQMRFSFQFAKRFGPLTGRFGILESTGGIGVDLHLLNDRFELRQDFFGFGEELSPRWRIAVSYEFLRKLWLLGGVDDILNDARRDYFVGLQLRFNDQDLKTILPFAPVP